MGGYLCDKCRLHLIKSPTICFYCGKSSLYGQTHHTCTRTNGIDGFFSLFRYNWLLKRLLGAVKFQLVRMIFSELWGSLSFEAAGEVVSTLKRWERRKTTGYLPVPLHPNRLRQRGFNQADQLAQYLNKLAPHPILQAAVRIKNTPPQSQQNSKQARNINIRGAFAIKEPAIISDKNIIVVDDVVTSGATVRQLARCLRLAGAAHVYLFTLARGRLA